VVVGDQLAAALEGVSQRDRPVGADDRDRAVDLDHRQPPPGGGDRVALAGVSLLARPQRLDLGEVRGVIDDARIHRPSLRPWILRCVDCAAIWMAIGPKSM